MRGSKLDRNDYVMILPTQKSLMEKYFVLNTMRGVCIKIVTNIDTIEKYIYEQAFVMNTIDVNLYNIIGTAVIITEKNLFKNETNNYSGGKYIKKSDSIYTDGVENTFYKFDKSRLVTNHYPIGNVHYMDNEINFSMSIIPNDVDASFIGKMAVKIIAANYYYKKLGFFSLHSAGVSYNNRGYVFIGGGRSGKTTTFLNLTSSGSFEPINDDILFWKNNNDGEIVIESIPLLSGVRKDSFNYINADLNLDNHPVGFDDDICLSVSKTFNTGICNRTALGILFLPKTGFDETKIRQVNPQDHITRILRACMVHCELIVDECFQKALNTLLQYQAYEIEISKNPVEFLNVFTAFLNNYQRQPSALIEKAKGKRR